MAGLLSGYVGDETVKDEFGMTQADRREPIWSGLIKAGLLGVAAGGNLMPDQRANLIGQMAGAFGDIPKGMRDAAAAGAQQKLQSQTLQEGARKNADRERIKAYAQTPEFLEMVKGASGPNRLAIQAAVDSGDMAALNTAIGNLDKTAIGLARSEAALAKVEAAKATAAAKEGRYKGANERLQHLDNLEHEDPGSQKYWAAWVALQQEMKAPDGTILPKMDLKAAGFREPTFVPPGGKPLPKPGEKDIDAEIADWSQPPGTVKPPQSLEDYVKIGQGLKNGGETEVNGIQVRKNSLGDIEVEPPDGPMTRVPHGTNERRSVEQKQVPGPVLDKLNNAEGAMTRIDSLETELKKSGIQIGTLASFFLPDGILSRTDPEGQKARTTITTIASQLVHDLSGGAVTPEEYRRIQGRIPQANDTPDTIRIKIEGLKDDAMRQGRTHIYNLGPGHRVPPELRKRFGGKASPAAPAGKPPPDDRKPDGTPLWRHKDGQLYTVPE